MNELERKMISSGWFASGKTLGVTIAKFESLGYEQDEIIEIVFDMHEWGVLYTYPSKNGECYRLSVQAEPESNIGV